MDWTAFAILIIIFGQTTRNVQSEEGPTHYDNTKICSHTNIAGDVYEHYREYYKLPKYDRGLDCPYKTTMSCFSRLRMEEKAYITLNHIKFRDWLGRGKNISNLFYVHWFDDYFPMMTTRIYRCLKPTPEGVVVFDAYTVLNHNLMVPISEFGSWAAPATISIREIRKDEIVETEMKKTSLDYHMRFLNNERILEYIGGTVMFSCGYILFKNDSHWIDHMMCMFFAKNTYDHLYKTLRGRPCSECDYWTYHLYRREDYWANRWSNPYNYTCHRVYKTCTEVESVLDKSGWIKFEYNDDPSLCPETDASIGILDGARYERKQYRTRCVLCPDDLKLLPIIATVVLSIGELLIIYLFFIM